MLIISFFYITLSLLSIILTSILLKQNKKLETILAFGFLYIIYLLFILIYSLIFDGRIFYFNGAFLLSFNVIFAIVYPLINIITKLFSKFKTIFILIRIFIFSIVSVLFFIYNASEVDLISSSSFGLFVAFIYWFVYEIFLILIKIINNILMRFNTWKR